MNAEPHVHELQVHDWLYGWQITYGDQHEHVRHPSWRDPAKVLASAVKAIVRKHDQESIKAGRKAEKTQDAIASALSGFTKTPAQGYWDVDRYTPADPNKWASEQI